MPCWLLLLSGCAVPRGGAAPATESWLACPEGMLPVGGGAAWLGEPDPRYGLDQAAPAAVVVAPFCIDDLPFPGRPGDPWMQDGLEAGRVADFEAMLAAVGLRLCTADELLWASTAGPLGQPFLGGASPPVGRCEPDASWGDLDPLGAWPDCRNALGLRDHGVMSAWVRATPAVGGGRGRPWVVLGGTNRPDTFYRPDNFGLHVHDPGDPPFGDDQVRVCADPGAPFDPGAWTTLQEAAALQGTYEGTLRWWARHGADAGPAELFDPPWVWAPDQPAWGTLPWEPG